ncbi:hypothetical protein M0811_07359 [Anaeramoeba ignava]|uniref:Uncharacterized protein n=1 Tax=Anaeramoeba ignava TaxID=1746090 RepID=A0A9Q0RE48_ANAIG|nr:hypothetical protein M0811_07359 [Anaeramoeba ignava]
MGTYSYKQNFISIKTKEKKIAKENYQKKYQNPNFDPHFYGYVDNQYFPFQPRDSKKYLLNEVILGINGIILLSTLIILNYFIDSKKSISIPKLFLLSEINLIITIFWVIYLKPTF